MKYVLVINLLNQIKARTSKLHLLYRDKQCVNCLKSVLLDVKKACMYCLTVHHAIESGRPTDGRFPTRHKNP